MAPTTVLSAERYYEPKPWRFAYRLKLSCGHSLDVRFRFAYQLPYKVREVQRVRHDAGEAWPGIAVNCIVC